MNRPENERLRALQSPRVAARGLGGLPAAMVLLCLASGAITLSAQNPPEKPTGLKPRPREESKQRPSQDEKQKPPETLKPKPEST